MRLTRNGLLIAILVAVLVIAGGAVWWLSHRQGKTGGAAANVNLNRSASEVQFNKDLDAFAKADWGGALDDRIEIIGGSLVNVPPNIVSDRIALVTKRKVHMNFTEGMTTRQAIGTLSTMLNKQPPRTIVYDIGRYDSSNGIDTQETSGNLSAMLMKGERLGIRAVVIGGIGSNGNLELASLLRPVVKGSAVFVDASSMLQDPALRDSPLELNEAGAAILADQIGTIVSKQ